MCLHNCISSFLSHFHTCISHFTWFALFLFICCLSILLLFYFTLIFLLCISCFIIIWFYLVWVLVGLDLCPFQVDSSPSPFGKSPVGTAFLAVEVDLPPSPGLSAPQTGPQIFCCASFCMIPFLTNTHTHTCTSLWLSTNHKQTNRMFSCT